MRKLFCIFLLFYLLPVEYPSHVSATTDSATSAVDTTYTTAATIETTIDTTLASSTTTNPETTESISTITYSETTSPSTTLSSSSVSTSTTTQPTTTTVPTTTQFNEITSPYTWTDADISKQPYVIIKVEEGYSISVEVSGIYMPDTSYLYIEGGESHNQDATDGRVFANDVKGPLKYLFKTNSVYAFCKVDKAKTVKFTVKFEKTGQPATTTTPTTTEISWPTTEQDDSTDLTVDVAGKSLEEFKKIDVTNAFKECVVGMAITYCSSQNITLIEEITIQNVIIEEVVACPYSWPNSETCVQIRFKLPIYYDNKKWNGYQLNREHLKIMWLRNAYNNQCFYEKGFDNYSEPDFNKSLILWIIGIIVVIAGFLLLLWFLKTCRSRLKSSMRRERRNSDRESIIPSKKDSLISLGPHYLQEHVDTPKFFET